MLNEFVYCPRLAYLEWVQCEWEDNADTLSGTRTHRRVDTAPRTAPRQTRRVEPGAEDPPHRDAAGTDQDARREQPEKEQPSANREGEKGKPKIHSRSLRLASTKLGIVAILDLVESTKNRVRPVDYKKSKRPRVPHGAYEPERVQLCAQGLLLREEGYECNEGILYFAQSKERVRVRFTEELVDRTKEALQQMRKTLDSGVIPSPLQDSPKCRRCSLVAICLPDETNFLRSLQQEVRPMTVRDRKLFPLIVQEPGSKVRLAGEQFRVEKQGKRIATALIGETSELVLMGGANCTLPAMRECARRDIPIAHMSGTGQLYGITRGLSHRNIELRIAQFSAAFDGDRCLSLAQQIVANKIVNSKVLLRRNGASDSQKLAQLSHYARRAQGAESLEQLLGFEGNASRIYFGEFTTMLRVDLEPGFKKRVRRPPTDPINSLLSFTYALLTKEWLFTLERVGLDPYLGFLHQPRYGRPALALDLMEPFRPVIADSVVLQVVNNGEVRQDSFRKTVGSVLLLPRARKSVLQAWERRMRTRIKHPVFGYRCHYRRVLEVQARLLGRFLLGEIDEYPRFLVR